MDQAESWRGCALCARGWYVGCEAFWWAFPSGGKGEAVGVGRLARWRRMRVHSVRPDVQPIDLIDQEEL